MVYVLKVKNLEKSFGKFKVIEDMTLSIKKGEKVTLLGPSGCGKTTFLRIIAGLEKFNIGNLELNAKRIGYVFQEPRLIPWLTIKSNLKLINDNEKEIEEILEALHLKGFENKLPSQLSGGMRQRVNIARALLYKADFLLFDEPFASLDLPVKIKIMNDILRIWEKKKLTMLMVTHDVKESIYMSDRIVILSPPPMKSLHEISVPSKMCKLGMICDEFMRLEAKLIELISNLLNIYK